MTNTNSFYLSNFESQEPKYHATQEQILGFLKKRASELSPKFYERYGVKSKFIEQRFFECPDVFLTPEKMHIYGPQVSDIYNRTLFYSTRADEIFESFYTNQKNPPDHLIHVTCTGYNSPSAPQKLISAKQWPTEVTHAYHMGCYASLPAIRMAWGLSHLGKSVDVVHTEMCSLHLSPEDFSPEQIIVQTLFADGHIKYSASGNAQKGSLKILKLKEKILPFSHSDMTWTPSSWGMKMSLSKEIPLKLSAHIRDFTQNLAEESGFSLSFLLKKGLFAIHPGGPRIIDTVSEVLELREEQIEVSREILLERGNMSSATLPHIWKRILERSPPPGTPIVSFAFGPGLTLIGAIFEVC